MLFRILLQFIGRYSCGLRFVRLDNYFVYFYFKVTLNWYDGYAVYFRPPRKPQKNLNILSSKNRKMFVIEAKSFDNQLLADKICNCLFYELIITFFVHKN